MNASDEHIDSQIELEGVYEHWIGNIFLDDCWEVFIELGQAVGDKNSFSLAAIFRFNNIEFILVLLFGENGEICGKDPCFGVKIILLPI